METDDVTHIMCVHYEQQTCVASSDKGKMFVSLRHLFVQFVWGKRLIVRQLVIHTRERLFGLVATAGLVQAPVCQQH